LPDLSVANVRSMRRAALPLPDLTADRAAALIVEHLVNGLAHAAAGASVNATPATTPDPNVTLSRYSRAHAGAALVSLRRPLSQGVSCPTLQRSESYGGRSSLKGIPADPGTWPHVTDLPTKVPRT